MSIDYAKEKFAVAVEVAVESWKLGAELSGSGTFTFAQVYPCICR